LNVIVQECVSSFPYFHRLQFCHIRRVANQAAHYLPYKFAISNLEFVWIEKTSSYIYAFVMMSGSI